MVNMTVRDWFAHEEFLKSKKSQKVRDIHYEFEHSDAAVTMVKDRADRFPLVSMYRDNAQVLQMREDTCECKRLIKIMTILVNLIKPL